MNDELATLEVKSAACGTTKGVDETGEHVMENARMIIQCKCGANVEVPEEGEDDVVLCPSCGSNVLTVSDADEVPSSPAGAIESSRHVAPVEADNPPDTNGVYAPANNRDALQEHRCAFRQLGWHAFILAGVTGIPAVIVTGAFVASPQLALSPLGLLGLAMVLFALLSMSLGIAAMRQRVWSAYVGSVFSGLLFAANGIACIAAWNSGVWNSRAAVNCGFYLFFNYAAERARKSARRNRWNLAAHPGFVALASQNDIASLLNALDGKTMQDKMLAIQALGSMGQTAAKAVPVLTAIAREASPPDPQSPGLCSVCGRRVTFMNRAFGTSMCAGCNNLLKSLNENPHAVPPTLAQLAVEALGQIGVPAAAACPVLEELVHSRDPRVSEAARRSLERIHRTVGGPVTTRSS